MNNLVGKIVENPVVRGFTAATLLTATAACNDIHETGPCPDLNREVISKVIDENNHLSIHSNKAIASPVKNEYKNMADAICDAMSNLHNLESKQFDKLQASQDKSKKLEQNYKSFGEAFSQILDSDLEFNDSGSKFVNLDKNDQELYKLEFRAVVVENSVNSVYVYASPDLTHSKTEERFRDKDKVQFALRFTLNKDGSMSAAIGQNQLIKPENISDLTSDLKEFANKHKEAFKYIILQQAGGASENNEPPKNQKKYELPHRKQNIRKLFIRKKNVAKNENSAIV